MDPDAALIVLKGFLTTCTAGACIGTTYGIMKRQPLIVPAINSSINSGLAGLSFFALREYVVGPVLVYTMPRETCIKRRNSLRAEQGMQSASTSSDSVSFSQMRSHKVLDTAFAGAGTGGILNAWRRGRPGVLPGALTAGLICTMAQLVWNELNVMRVQYVSQSGVTHSDHDVAPTPHKPFSEKIMDGLAVVFPVRKISDEVYLERLLREKEAVERRLEAVRKELQDAERRDNS